MLTTSIKAKMIVHGPLIGRKKIGEVEQNSKFAGKVVEWLTVCLAGTALLVLFEKSTRSSSLDQGSTACCSTVRKQ